MTYVFWSGAVREALRNLRAELSCGFFLGNLIVHLLQHVPGKFLDRSVLSLKRNQKAAYLRIRTTQSAPITS
jgi:hypothetical protein